MNRLTTGPEGSTAVLEARGDGAPVRIEVARVLRGGGAAAARPAPAGARGFGILKKD